MDSSEIPPGVTLDHLKDPSIPIAIVEGEKKSLALVRLAYHESEKPRFIPVAISGVWNWRGTTGRRNGPKGERVEVKGPIADLNRIEWTARKVFVVFDANVHTNDDVNWARKGIAKELAKRGAEVQFVNLPEDCGVNGIDDLLATWGPARVLVLFDEAVSGARLQVVAPTQFQSRADGLFRVTTRGETLSQVQLTNYRAEIVANVRLDDGIETKLEFEVESELLGRPFRFALAASEFAKMDWAIKRMGSSAITFPNQWDYARTAIQSFSTTAAERCIYTHTGWREVNGCWIFLHRGGAVCGEGAVSDVDVRLSGPLRHYELSLPPGPDELVAAVRAGLRLMELGPPSISFPLMAATVRAVFGDADFAVHLAGETGAFKSELAALHQQHFGVAMDRTHLPGAWSSTGNAIEALAFHAKDTLLVVDDFAPQGSGTDVARYHAAADRVFRAAGNQAGRGRLDSSAKLREPKHPRALILSTGEEIPRGQSVRARLLILELSKGGIKPANLTECQRDAQGGLYCLALSSFVRWLAVRYIERRAAFTEKVSVIRLKVRNEIAHARTPDIIANLQTALEFYLEFAVACGALDAAAADRLTRRSWDAHRDAAAAQAKHHGESEPTAKFLTILRSLIASGRAHLASRTGGRPDHNSESCGWRPEGGEKWLACGDRIGWVDGDDVYLEPSASYRALQGAANAIGDAMPISEQTLRKRMREKGLLASADESRQTLTVRRTIHGSTMSVLHLLRRTILPDEEDESVG